MAYKQIRHADRAARLKDLRAEINSLLAEEAAENRVDVIVVQGECLKLLKEDKKSAAICHARSRLGCSLSEAYNFVMNLKAKS